LEFDQHGTFPLYKASKTFGSNALRFMKRFVPTGISWYCLNANPYPFCLEPLCLPFFLVYGLVGSWRCFKLLADNALTVYEVRLINDGVHVEIFLHNFLGLKSNKKRFTIDIKDLSPPPLHPDSIPLKGDLFPHLPEGFEVKNERIFEPWVKYNLGVRRKLFIPKRYSFMQQELMVAAMNGCYIKYNL
jgi:hypothetical protein